MKLTKPRKAVAIPFNQLHDVAIQLEDIRDKAYHDGLFGDEGKTALDFSILTRAATILRELKATRKIKDQMELKI